MQSTDEGDEDFWVVDLQTRKANRLTFAKGRDLRPIWSPSGADIAFQSLRAGVFDLWIRPSSGGGAEHPLYESSTPWKEPDSWVGDLLAFVLIERETGVDISLLRTDRPGDPAIPLLNSPASENRPAISPDGRWLAYDSNEEAHERGIIHRDLKPANVKVMPEGKVKILDFGLAKAMEGDPSTSAANSQLSNSPTMSRHMTEAGMIMGTAAYMSPEQARGKAVDKRSDIWSFGVVVFEMLTGARLFAGETVSDTLAAVLTREPQWDLLPQTLPRTMRGVLRRCLERNPKQRLHDIADARLSIEDVLSGAGEHDGDAAGTAAGKDSAVRRTVWIIAALALLATGMVAGRFLLPGPRETAETNRLSILLPPGGFSSQVDPAVSPDGRTIAFAATDGSTNATRLWLRDLNSLTPRPVPESDGANQPFWSPDGKWVGFFARNKVMKAPRSGGSPQTLAEASNPRGGTWNARGDILFTPDSFIPIHRTKAGGAKAQALPGPSGSEPDLRIALRHVDPSFLPDGRHFLFVRGSSISVGSLDSAEIKDVAPILSRAQYAMGHLFFVREGDLYAQPFNPDRAALSGEASKVADGVGWAGRTPPGFAFSVSEAGVIAYWSYSALPTRQLIWFDRAGKNLGNLGEPGEYNGIDLSPDGRQVALELHEPKAGPTSIWMMDVASGARSRFATLEDWTGLPIWSADSKHLLVTDFSENLHILSTDGGPRHEVPVGYGNRWPSHWSRDGRTIVFTLTETNATRTS
ncbi:MAG: PD40 domain-containing protein [Vicinamibacteria bacterium]|nr:PD40 domain-containing protein [Vicinamibacteria bacterium]